MNPFSTGSVKALLSLLLAVWSLFSFSGCGGDDTTPNGMKDGAEITEFEENLAGYTLFVPQSWTVRMASGAVAATAPSPSSVTVSMTTFALTGSTTIAAEWDTVREELEKACTSFEILSQPDFTGPEQQEWITKIDGRQAAVFTYQAVIGQNTRRYRLYLFSAGGNLYLLTYSASPAEFDGSLSEMDTIAAHLTLRKNAEAPEGMKAAVKAEDRDVLSDKFHFYIGEDWTADTSTGVYCARFSSFPTTFTVMTAPLTDPSVAIDDYFRAYEADFQKSFGSYTLDSSTAVTLNGSAGSRFQAMEYEYTAGVGGEGDAVQAYRFCQILCKNKGEMYILTFSTTENYYENHVNSFLNILDHFEIME